MSDPTLNKPLHIWISHSPKDKFFVLQLMENLVAKEHELSIDGTTLDLGDLITLGDSIINSVAESIQKADVVLVVVSKTSSTNPYVTRELAFALSEQSKRGKPYIIPLKLQENALLPTLIADLQFADFTNPSQFTSQMEKLLSVLKAISENKNSVSQNQTNYRPREEFIRAQKHALTVEISQAETKRYFRHGKLRSLLAVTILTVLSALILLIRLYFPLTDAQPAFEVIVTMLSLVIGAIVGYYFSETSRQKL